MMRDNDMNQSRFGGATRPGTGSARPAAQRPTGSRPAARRLARRVRTNAAPARGQSAMRGAAPASAAGRPASRPQRRAGKSFDLSRLTPDRRLSLIRAALVLALIVYTALVIRSTSARDVPFDRVAAAMAAAPGIEALESGDENEFQERFGASPEGCEGWLLYGSSDIMDVSELLIAKVPDERVRNALEDAAQARLDGQLEAFRGYGTNQSKLLEDAILWQRGSYLFYGVSEDVDLWEARFLSQVG